jgi:hypothetical protein
MIDIFEILLMLALMVITFSNSLYILDKSSKSYEPGYESFILKVTENTFTSLLIQQLQLGLGNIPTDHLAKNKHSPLIWFYILTSIIMTNIAFLNILITKVNNSYERIMESKESSHLKQ